MFAVFPDINRVAGVDLFYPIIENSGRNGHMRNQSICPCSVIEIVTDAPLIRQAGPHLAERSWFPA